MSAPASEKEARERLAFLAAGPAAQARASRRRIDRVMHRTGGGYMAAFMTTVRWLWRWKFAERAAELSEQIPRDSHGQVTSYDALSCVERSLRAHWHEIRRIGEHDALKFVRAHWDAIERLAAALLERGALDERELVDLYQGTAAR